MFYAATLALELIFLKNHEDLGKVHENKMRWEKILALV